MDETDDAGCCELASAMLLRFHPAAAARAGLALTPAQLELFEAANLRRMHLASRLPDPKGSGVRLPGLRSQVREVLDPLLGKPLDIDGQQTWRYRTPVAGVVLVTLVDLSGRSRQLEYEHWVEAAQGGLLRRGVSLASWLGVSSATQWDLLMPEHVSDAVDQMHAQCRHFMQALPRLAD
ncbi:Hypothetical protein Rta_36610 [Ramlibacter tataouinensis TTB310]|uniref:Uncharacterized protein n=2 Tax=Ramlibacter tataouinensis TaxID=94132 RepID=F5Y1J1_RAMTT|nr:Hypothetical protein Rta_36610 [Ramlibacter tataouinensis TTB310]